MLAINSIFLNMDTQSDGLEHATPLKYGPFLVSMFDFWGVIIVHSLEIL